jgi:copper chaperone CopZ
MKSKNWKMMQIVTVLVAVLSVVALTAGQVSAGDEPDSEVETAAFNVDGMTCGGCEVAVRRVVNKLDGIETVEASHEEGTATVTYHPEEVTPEQIVEAIETLGYEAELQADPGTDT